MLLTTMIQILKRKCLCVVQVYAYMMCTFGCMHTHTHQPNHPPECESKQSQTHTHTFAHASLFTRSV